MATAAQHHGRPVDVSRTISAPAEAVWDAISFPGYLEKVHPFCERNPVAVWPGRVARDEIHYRSGWIYQRTFTDWIDGIGYDLDIGAVGEPTSHVKWRIAGNRSGGCELVISVWPRSMTSLRGVSWFTRTVIIGPMMRRYLRSVTKGVEWFVTRGEPVAADQFGFHIWFSARRQFTKRILISRR